MTIRKPTIFGTGLIALDVVISDTPDTPVLESVGGSCGNVLTILSFLGWKSVPVARMNGDPASIRVRSDMKKWGVVLDHAGVEPQTHTPIVVQQLYHTKQGSPRHRFDWVCPKCGERLPSFKAITRSAVESVGNSIEAANVFFMDRLSRGTLALAEKVSENGGIVFFEPSGFGDQKLFAEALELSDVVKYAKDRIGGIERFYGDKKPLVEIQTLGSEGLRVRDCINGRQTKWRSSSAITALELKDTCGSGDWCSAGIIFKAFAEGRDHFVHRGRDALNQAINYGQLLAAWNCAFEGARGGMYTVASFEEFNREIAVLQTGSKAKRKFTHKPFSSNEVVDCPSCS